MHKTACYTIHTITWGKMPNTKGCSIYNDKHAARRTNQNEENKKGERE